MRYASIRSLDVSNGEGIGVALFLQGCYFRCKGCFNPSTWDFNGGFEWNDEIEGQFLKIVGKPYISRVSILGGEPLEQADEISILLSKIKSLYPQKTVWMYTGYLYEDVKDYDALKWVDVLVDGQYEASKRDLNLKFRGSSNQRIIDVKKGELYGKFYQE